MLKMVYLSSLKKAFNILFCFYFLALVAMPCGDKEDCNEKNHTELSDKSSHKDHSGEVCSPFCTCACCASHFINSNFSTTLNYIAITSPVYKVHAVSKITSVIIPVWQPPKLA